MVNGSKDDNGMFSTLVVIRRSLFLIGLPSSFIIY